MCRCPSIPPILSNKLLTEWTCCKGGLARYNRTWRPRCVGVYRAGIHTHRLHSLTWLLLLALPSGLSLALVWACLSSVLPNLHHLPSEHHCISELHHSAVLCQVHTPTAQRNPGVTRQPHPTRKRLKLTTLSCDLLFNILHLEEQTLILCLHIRCSFCLTHSHTSILRKTHSAQFYAPMPITEQMTSCCVARCHSEFSCTPHLQLSQTQSAPVSEGSFHSLLFQLRQRSLLSHILFLFPSLQRAIISIKHCAKYCLSH